MKALHKQALIGAGCLLVACLGGAAAVRTERKRLADAEAAAAAARAPGIHPFYDCGQGQIEAKTVVVSPTDVRIYPYTVTPCGHDIILLFNTTH